MKKDCIAKIEIDYYYNRVCISLLNGLVCYDGQFSRLELDNGELTVYFSQNAEFIFVRARHVYDLPDDVQGWIIEEIV